jgi:alkyl hydroperoxide reductase subunit F
MLDAALKTQLAGYLGRLTQPIELVASLDDSPTAHEIRALLADIAEASSQVTVVEATERVEFVPSFAIRTVGGESRVRFAGVPMGHEFTSLVLALLQVGGYPPKVEAALIEQIRGIEGDFEFQTFVSLSCHNCPDVVQAFNLMAVLNPRIRHTMVEGGAFQDVVTARDIMSVPSVFLNGELFGSGRMTLEEIVAKIDTGAERRRAAELTARDPYDVLIVGGGPAGSAAAIYAARKGIRTGIAAERFGGQVLDTLGIENFISVTHTEGPKLVTALEQHVREYGVDIMNLERAEALVPGELIEVKMRSGAVLKARSVVLSTGARWREMNVPGEAQYRNKGVAYCPHCDGPLFKGKPVAVIGGGNSGVEAAIDLAGIVSHVTLLEFASTLRADAVLVRKLKSLPNVTVLTDAQSTEVVGDGERVTALRYTRRTDGTSHEIALAGIFVQIGLIPNTDWLKGVVKLTARGEVEVDARGETSVPGVFAAGDCTTVPYKQIVIAVGEGAKAALSAFDHLIRVPVADAAAA